MLKTLIERYPVLKDSKADIKAAAEKIIDCYEKGGKLILCGNGGSSSDCDHIVGELMKGFLKMRPLSEEKKSQMLKNCPLLDDETLSISYQLQNDNIFSSVGDILPIFIIICSCAFIVVFIISIAIYYRNKKRLK